MNNRGSKVIAACQGFYCRHFQAGYKIKIHFWNNNLQLLFLFYKKKFTEVHKLVFKVNSNDEVLFDMSWCKESCSIKYPSLQRWSWSNAKKLYHACLTASIINKSTRLLSLCDYDRLSIHEFCLLIRDTLQGIRSPQHLNY